MSRRRIEDLEKAVDHVDKRMDRLENRINYLFGALAVIVVLANIAAAVVVGSKV